MNKIENPSMELRDWFAGQALVAVSHLAEYITIKKDEAHIEALTKLAYKMADAMMAVRTGHKPIDIDHMLAVCVPGGSSCDPQVVADRIREYWRANGGAA